MFILHRDGDTYMSILVAYCTRESCTFWADTRGINQTVDEITAVYDDARKVTRVNSSLLFGTTGHLDLGESVSLPIDACKNWDTMKVDGAKEAVISFAKRGMPGLTSRTYTLGGKGDGGQYIMYKIHIGSDELEPDVEIIAPYASGHSSGLFICSSPYLRKNVRQMESALKLCLTSPLPDSAKVEAVKSIILSNTKDDPTVSDTIEVYRV